PSRALRHASTYICRSSVLSWPKIIASLWQFFGARSTAGGRLVPVFAQVGNDAARALRAPCLADIAAMQQQPVVSVLAKFGRRQPREPCLHFHRGLACGDARPVRDPEYMRVHWNYRLSVRGIEDDVGGFPAYAGQCLQFRTRPGYLATILFHQDPAGLDDVFGFRVEQANGFYVALESGDAKSQHVGRRRCVLEQLRRCLVYANVGRLRRQYDRYQQLE